MKKNVFLAILALCFAASTMYAESPDRKTVITNPKKVTISEENGKAVISVIEQKGDTSYDYKYEITSATPLSVSSTSDWDVNYPFKRDRSVPCLLCIFACAVCYIQFPRPCGDSRRSKADSRYERR